MINDFHNENYFLSNFAPSPLYYDGILYPTVEHAFQAAKMVNESDRLAIQAAVGPNMAKRIGRHGLMRSDWEDIKVEVMRKCLMRKFLLDPELRQKLRTTAPQELVEGNTWHDNCWGDCSCSKCANKKGTNYLGKLLMEIRDKDIAGHYAFACQSNNGGACIFATAEECKQFLLSQGYPLDDKHFLIIDKNKH